MKFLAVNFLGISSSSSASSAVQPLLFESYSGCPPG
jgi:hypothetical protein